VRVCVRVRARSSNRVFHLRCFFDVARSSIQSIAFTRRNRSELGDKCPGSITEHCLVSSFWQKN
jgi:hypothetical protein